MPTAMAEDVVASMFGDWVRELKYFWFGPAEIEGIPVLVAFDFNADRHPLHNFGELTGDDVTGQQRKLGAGSPVDPEHPPTQDGVEGVDFE